MGVSGGRGWGDVEELPEDFQNLKIKFVLKFIRKIEFFVLFK